jgi:hypothetical protein
MRIGYDKIGFMQYQSFERTQQKRLERITTHLSHYFDVNDIDYKQLKDEPQTELNRLIEKHYRKDAPSYVDTKQLQDIYKISFAHIKDDLREHKAFKPQTEKDFEIHTDSKELVKYSKLLNEATQKINELIDERLISIYEVGSLSRGFKGLINVDTSNVPYVTVNAHALLKL